jgi:hypothetical protein
LGGARPDPEALGLSKGHNSPQRKTEQEKKEEEKTPHIKWYKGSGLFVVKNPQEKRFDWKGAEQREKEAEDRAQRGFIFGFSRKSQNNLKRGLATIPDSELMNAILVTLTYPSEFPAPEEYQIYKTHLDRFAKTVFRKGFSGYWVLEFQKRGAPHFHLILFKKGQKRGQSLKALQEMVSRRWYECVGSGDYKHFKAGTEVAWPDDAGSTRGYVAKYVSKGDQAADEGINVGRYWGKINAKEIPRGEEVIESITPRQAKVAARVMKRAVANRVKVSGWGRLHKRVRQQDKVLKGTSLEEFRRAAQAIKGGALKVEILRPDGKVVISDRQMWVAIAKANPTAEHINPLTTLPKKYRSRNNSTIHLFCNADNFRETLTRHPDWHGKEEKEEEQRQRENRGMERESDREGNRRSSFRWDPSSVLETLMPTMPPWEIQQHRQNIQILVKDMGCEFREEWSEDPIMDSKECRFTIRKDGKILKEVIHGAGNISFMRQSGGFPPSPFN